MKDGEIIIRSCRYLCRQNNGVHWDELEIL